LNEHVTELRKEIDTSGALGKQAENMNRISSEKG
jgi:hypothetical protein